MNKYHQPVKATEEEFPIDLNKKRDDDTEYSEDSEDKET